MKKKITLIASLLFCVQFLFSQVVNATYYSKSAGNLNTPATWGMNTNGSGTQPTVFTTAGCTYIIVNNAAATIGANWTVSGAGSVIQVGDGVQTINFTTAGFTVAGTINVFNLGTLTINSAANPTLGTLSAGSTVAYTRAGAQNVVNATYTNLTLGGSGNKTLANVSSTSVAGVLNIAAAVPFLINNSQTLTLNGTLTGAGTITGGANANITIGGTGAFGTIIPTAAPLTLNTFILNRAALGVVTLGNNVTVSTTGTFSNGVLNLNGHTLILNGTQTLHASAANGTFTGSAASGLTIGATSITNNLFFTAGFQTLNNFTLNSAGQTLKLGSDLTVSGAYAHTNGIIDLNGKTLSLSGTLTFPAAVGNGTTTGSATSNLLISATTITNSLFLTAGAQTLNNFTLNSPGRTLTLGTAMTVGGTYTQTNGILALNGQILTLNGTAIFPLAAANGTITGTAASDLIINATSITNPVFFTGAGPLRNLTLNCAGQTLKLGSNANISGAYTQTNGILNINGTTLTLSGTIVFPATAANGTISGSASSNLLLTGTSITNNLFMTAGAQTLNNLTLNSAGQTLKLGSDLTVSGAYAQTNGIVNINGNTLSLSGTATFPAAVGNGTITGSATSSLLISATAITNNLNLTVGSQTLNNFTLNSPGRTLTLGTAITVGGTFTQTAGILALNGQVLTLNGAAAFPAAAANGTITGTAASDLNINATSITNPVFFTGAGAMRNLTLNCPGQTLKLGSNLTVSGALTQTKGILDINGTTLSLSGTIVFPTTAANGTISGSATSNLSITGTSITNNLFMTAGSQTLNNLTLNKAGLTLSLGSNLTVSGTYAQTNGIVNINGNTLLLSGTATFPAAVANGTITGSATSNLLISATTITNNLNLTAGAQTLNNFTLNSPGKTLRTGTALTVSGTFNHTNGVLRITGMPLTLSGTIVFPVASANGTITGSNTSTLTVTGTSVSNSLFFTAGSQTLKSFVVNCPGQTVNMGSALTVATTFTLSNGILNLNGQTLTINGTATFPVAIANGSFSGSATSSLAIGGAGAYTNSLLFTQSGTANNMNNITLNRTAQTLTLGNTLNLVGTLTPTAGTFAAGNNLTLIATSYSVTARIGTIGATGNVTGNVTAQTYAKGGNTGWTTIGAAGISGRTFADWNDNFAITCANCPDGYNVGGSNFGSIQLYSETAGGLLSAAGRYTEIANITDAMTIGKGFWVYLGNSTTTSTDIIMDITGPIAKGNFAMPLTITNAGGGTNATDHGYNLLANPYPSPINWTSLRNGNGSVGTSISVYNPDIGGHASYNITGNVSNPTVASGGIGNLIPAGQGFYVKASAATTLTALETYKGASTQALLRMSGNHQVTSTANPMVLRLLADGASMHFKRQCIFTQLQQVRTKKNTMLFIWELIRGV
jgi:hypothetical protein